VARLKVVKPYRDRAKMGCCGSSSHVADGPRSGARPLQIAEVISVSESSKAKELEATHALRKVCDETRNASDDAVSTTASERSEEQCGFKESTGWQLRNAGSLAEHSPKDKFCQLISSQSASTGILEWTFFLDSGMDCWLAGVVPESMAPTATDYLLHQCKTGVKGTGAGGCKKEQFTMNQLFLRTVCDLDQREVTFFVGTSPNNLMQRSKQSLKLKQGSSVRLAVGITSSQTGRVHLVPHVGTHLVDGFHSSTMVKGPMAASTDPLNAVDGMVLDAQQGIGAAPLPNLRQHSSSLNVEEHLETMAKTKGILREAPASENLIKDMQAQKKQKKVCC